MHLIVLLIIAVAILVVVFKQWRHYKKVQDLQDELEVLMMPVSYSIDETDGCKLIKSENIWSLHHALIKQVNAYLKANSGVAANFDIVKDIIERKSNEMDERIRSQMPLPLYLGLCGTIFGIIVGLLPMILPTILSLLGIGVAQEDADIMSNISYILGGVAFAMLGSLVGILLTTRSQSRYKDVIAKHEAGKNYFYTWFQIEMLPTLGGDNIVGKMGHFVTSLHVFSNSFQGTAQMVARQFKRVEQVSKDISESFQSQHELLDLLHKLSETNITAENCKLLERTRHHIDVIGSFNNSIVGMQHYVEKLQSVTHELTTHPDYLKVVRQLTETLNAGEQTIKTTVDSQTQLLNNAVNDQRKVLDDTLNAIKKQNQDVVEVFLKHLGDISRGFEKNLEAYPDVAKSLNALPTAMEQLTTAITTLGQGQAQIVERLKTMDGRVQSVEQRLKKGNGKSQPQGNNTGGVPVKTPAPETTEPIEQVVEGGQEPGTEPPTGTELPKLPFGKRILNFILRRKP